MGVEHREPSQAGRPDQQQALPDAGKDYSAALSSIRADQDRETFVADLRQHKESLLSLAQKLMRNRGNTREEHSSYLSVGIYLDTVLKMHVFDIDPFTSNKYPDNEQLREDKEILAFDLVQRAGFAWFDKHPDSQAARAVALHSIYAFPDQHQELLKEMWPAIQKVVRYSEYTEKKN